MSSAVLSGINREGKKEKDGRGEETERERERERERRRVLGVEGGKV